MDNPIIARLRIIGTYYHQHIHLKRYRIYQLFISSQMNSRTVKPALILLIGQDIIDFRGCHCITSYAFRFLILISISKWNWPSSMHSIVCWILHDKYITYFLPTFHRVSITIRDICHCSKHVLILYFEFVL